MIDYIYGPPKPKRAPQRDLAADMRALAYSRLPRLPAFEAWQITVPIRTVSEQNQREHRFKRSERKHAQQAQLGSYLARMSRLPLPAHVTFTRIGVGKLDPDAVSGSFKHVQDELCRWLGCDDGDESSVTFTYAKRRGGPGQYAVEIRIEART